MDIVEKAKSYKGKVAYSFGADNIDGGVGDCSAFTKTVYSKYGKNIGRTTTEQLNNSTKIKKEDLQKGDLVFFQGTYKPGVSHVGIYIGGGKFVHNSDSGVIESSIDSPYYKKHWLTGGRIEGMNNSKGVEFNGSNEKPLDDLEKEYNTNLGLVGNISRIVVIVFILALGIAALLSMIKGGKKNGK